MNLLSPILNNFSAQISDLSVSLNLDIFEANIINFRTDIFIMGLFILYGFGLYINYRLFNDYNSRELIRSNVNTIVLQTIFCIFYIMLFYL